MPQNTKSVAVCDDDGNVTHVEVTIQGETYKHDVTAELDAVYPRTEKVRRALYAALIGAKYAPQTM